MINATKKWIFLKVSSVILIPLMVWFIINLVSIYEKDYIHDEKVKSVANKALTIFAIIIPLITIIIIFNLTL